MSLPIDPADYNINRELASILEKLDKLNINFQNDSDNATNAEILKVTEKVVSGATGDGNVGVAFSNSVISANIPADVVTTVFSTTSYFFAGTSQGVWVYDRNTNTGQVINTVLNTETVTILQELVITWDNISNVPVVDPANVAQWNAYFDLPTNGTPFTSVYVTGNVVNLKGGSGITLKDSLFYNNQHIVSVLDTLGCVILISDSVFTSSLTLVSVNFPSATSVGTSCFGGCTALASVSFPLLVTAGAGSFNNTLSLLVINFPSLTTALSSCFAGNVNTRVYSLPLLVTAGNNCFSNCYALTTISLPSLVTAGDTCFAGCTALVTVMFPVLVTAGNTCFSNCTALTTVILPSLATLGTYFFSGCTALTKLSLPAITNMGGTVGSDNVFHLITGNTITLAIPSAMLVCNSGNPDGDIQALQGANTVAVIVDPELLLTWNMLGLPVVDPANVSQWNTFFDLPVNGTPFTSVVVTGDVVNLKGGSGITTKLELFNSNQYLLSIEDTGGCIIIAGTSSFLGCSNLTLASLPGLITASSGNCFANCLSLTIVNLRLLETIGFQFFYNCPSLVVVDLPKVITAAGACFVGDTAIVVINLPLLQTAGDSCFSSIGSLTTISLPKLVTGGSYCFQNCISLATVNLPLLASIEIFGFSGCSSLVEVSLPSLAFAGYGIFNFCTSLTTINLPILASSGDYIFGGCTSLVNVSLPKLVRATEGAFWGCTGLVTIDLPSVSIIGINAFENCTSLTSISLPALTDLGGTVGANDVFLGITGNAITLTIPAALMTCNSGDPDGDIQYLQANNTVTINSSTISNNDIRGFFFHETAQILYVASHGGGVYAYNLVSGSITFINTLTTVTGDALPSDNCTSVTVDTVNNILVVGTSDAGLWIYNIATNTGKVYDTSAGAATGDQLPSMSVFSIAYDYANDFVWVGTLLGVWRYDTVTDDGKTYNTSGGAGTGDQLPGNQANSVYHDTVSDTLYVGTNTAGVWVYDVAGDTGSIIDTTTVVTGDALPENVIKSVFYNATSNELYIGTGTKGVWILDVATTTGKVYNTTTSLAFGGSLMNNSILSLWYDTGGDLAVATNGGGLWTLNIPADNGVTYRAGSGVTASIPSNIIFQVGVDIANNTIYSATLGGVFRWDEVNQSGYMFNISGGAANGAQLPSNTCVCAYMDNTNKVLYIGTSDGLWRYKLATDTGTVFTTGSGVGTGDQLPNNLVHGVFVDETTGKVYAATSGGFWIYDTLLDTGKAFTTAAGAANGEQLPAQYCTDCVKYPGSDYVWVITNGGGAWRYNETTDTGKIFNMDGGAGNGSQIPSIVGWSVVIEADVVWFATNEGVWKYKVSTDTGSVINTSTSVGTGLQLPENSTISLSIDIPNQILRVGMESAGIWEWQIGQDIGNVYNPTGGQTSGDELPSYSVYAIIVDSTNSNLWASTNGGGIWQYKLFNTGLLGSYDVKLSANEVSNYIMQTLDIINNPIVIFMFKIVITGSTTFNNVIRYKSDSPYGVGQERTIILNSYVSALNNKSGDIIDVPIPQGLLMTNDHYFEYPLDPWERVEMIMYYVRVTDANIVRGQINRLLLRPFDPLVCELDEEINTLDEQPGGKPSTLPSVIYHATGAFWLLLGAAALWFLFGNHDDD